MSSAETAAPYRVAVEITGTSDLLFQVNRPVREIRPWLMKTHNDRLMLIQRHNEKEKAGHAVATTAEPNALGGDVSEAGNDTILLDAPYRAAVEITGDSAILFHRWQSDSVEAKARAAKGSAAKKTDDVESYVWRNDNGQLCLPGEYLRGSLVDPRNGAAKYRQDPRSPRKSALDLFRAGVISLTDLAVLTKADGTKAEADQNGTGGWDYLDRRRVTVQRNGVTRERPALSAGWKAEVLFMVTSPAYIDARALHQTLNQAGLLVGVGDFRPTFGRFSVTRFEVLDNSR